jgi:hypothetical protein
VVTITDVSWSPEELTGSLEIGERAHPFYFRSSAEISQDADALLPVSLVPAMKTGAPLRLPGEISPRLLKNCSLVQDLFHDWEEDLHRTRVNAETRSDESATPGSGVACFFSGGVDSFFSVLRHLDEVTHLIFVVGFDIAAEGRSPLRDAALRMAREVAQALGKTLVEVETNVRTFTDRYVDWLLYHGPVLASVALLHQRTFRKVFIPATHTYAHPYPMGTHPLLDPLWSTEFTEFVHDGGEATRPEKVGFIAGSELAMDWLRVCAWSPKGEYNCGRCEKCLRTMINLRLNGALGKCRTLPGQLDLRQVEAMVVGDDPSEKAHVEENLRAIRRLGGDPALERSLQKALRGRFRRRALEASKRRMPAPLRRVIWGTKQAGMSRPQRGPFQRGGSSIVRPGDDEGESP